MPRVTIKQVGHLLTITAFVSLYLRINQQNMKSPQPTMTSRPIVDTPGKKSSVYDDARVAHQESKTQWMLKSGDSDIAPSSKINDVVTSSRTHCTTVSRRSLVQDMCSHQTKRQFFQDHPAQPMTDDRITKGEEGGRDDLRTPSDVVSTKSGREFGLEYTTEARESSTVNKSRELQNMKYAFILSDDVHKVSHVLIVV